MQPGTIILLVMLGIIILFVILAFIFWGFRPATTQDQISGFQLEYLPISFWGGDQAGPDPTRNTCQLYQFEGQMINLGTDPTAVPANPTLNPQVLNSLEPQGGSSCYDVDQIVATQVQHICISPQDVAAGDFVGTDSSGQKGVSFCTSADGTRVKLGTSEVYYSQSSTLFNSQGQPSGSITCSNSPCAGILSLLAFNYITGGPDLIYNNALCMSVDSTDPTNPTFTGLKCDIGDQTQLIRLNRSMPTSNTTAVQGTEPTSVQGKVGAIASLFDRQSNLLIVPNSDETGLALANNFEKVWSLVPNLHGSTVSSMQQIVYIGDLTSSQIAEFNNVINAEQLLNLIISTQRKSIQLDGSNNLILAPFVTFPNNTAPPLEDYLATFQYVNYPLFNQVLLTTQPTVF